MTAETLPETRKTPRPMLLPRPVPSGWVERASKQHGFRYLAHDKLSVWIDIDDRGRVWPTSDGWNELDVVWRQTRAQTEILEWLGHQQAVAAQPALTYADFEFVYAVERGSRLNVDLRDGQLWMNLLIRARPDLHNRLFFFAPDEREALNRLANDDNPFYYDHKLERAQQLVRAAW